MNEKGRQKDGERRKTRGRRFAENVAAGMDQKSAALRAGYSLSVAEHPKRKLWNQKNIVAHFQKIALRTLPPTRAEKLLNELLEGKLVVTKLKREKTVDANGDPVLVDGKPTFEVVSAERTESVDRRIQLRTLELVVAHGGLLPSSPSAQVISSESLDEVLARAERERVQHETQLAPSWALKRTCARHFEDDTQDASA